jgi:heme-degrading monooxygenase HmoA
MKETNMFARSVTIRVKSHAVGEYNQTLENEVLPLLRKQKGFRDELSLVTPNGSEVIAISLWDRKEDAEAYQRGSYAEVQRILSKVIEGSPRVQTYEVPLSTAHTQAARHGAPA